MKLIVTVDCKDREISRYIDSDTVKENMMTEVWKGIQKQLEEKGYKIITLSVEEYKDNSFNFVVFDPPHLINCGKNSWLAKKYGKLDKDSWQETLSKGLSECLRVVKPGCVVAIKWSEHDIKTTELLKILPQKPAFGDKSGMTRWLFFVKGVEHE